MGIIKDTWKEIPGFGKLLILAGGGYGIYKGVNWIVKKTTKSDDDITTQQAKTDLENILKNNLLLPPGQQTLPSFSKSQYLTFADTIYNSMDGAGTDEEALKGAFKEMQNDVDILYLIDAFGTRAGTSMFATSTEEDLAKWLQADGMTTTVNDTLKTKALITKRF
jgi:hypothetical protein